jgi:hypothetical protein
MRVDCNISDIFFNLEHETDETGDHTELDSEATWFLEALDRLGVDTPSVEELISDFYDRI